MKRKLTWYNVSTHEEIKVLNQFIIELEIEEFRAKSMIEYHTKKMKNLNEDLRELHQYFIDFYTDLVAEIRQQRLYL